VSIIKLTSQKYTSGVYFVLADGRLVRWTAAEGTALVNLMPASSYTRNSCQLRALSNGNLLHAGGTAGLLRSLDYGHSWVVAQATNLVDVAMHDDLRGYAVGPNAALYKTIDGGASWTSVALGVGTTELTSVCCVRGSSKTAFLFGKNYNGAFGNQDLIMKTVDGVSWTLQDSNVASDALKFASVSDSGLLVAVSDIDSGGGSCSPDGGTTWTRRTPSYVGADTGCAIVGSAILWASTAGAAPYYSLSRSTDGGVTWTNLLVGSTYVYNYGLTLLGSGIGYLSLTTGAYRTVNGGTNWEYLSGTSMIVQPVTSAAFCGYVEQGPGVDLEIV
jgi:hypothetical protein